MGFPADLHLVAVSGTILNPADGSPATGTVTFAIPYPLVDTTGHVIVGDAPIVAQLVNGSFTVNLPATDQSQVRPLNWVYTITINTPAGYTVFQAALPQSPASTTLDQLVPVVTPPAVGIYLPLTMLGQPNGAASLDGTGKLPVAQLPSGGGVPDATTSSKGVLELAGDIAGTATAVLVTGTHLAAPLPIAQGGTGSATQPFVDLTTGQTVAGVKTFSSAPIVPAGAFPESAIAGLIADLAAKAADAAVVHLAGTETVTGAKTFSGTVTVPAPVNPTDPATKAYVDAVAQGLVVKTSVAAATNTNTTLTGAQTIDGVAVTAGQRVLLTGQTTASQNGIWVVASGAWARPVDFATGTSQLGAFVFVEAGTTHSASGWVLTGTTPVVVDVGAQTWTQFSEAGGGVTSVNTRTGAVTLTKTDVGLDQVDDTADLAKPSRPLYPLQAYGYHSGSIHPDNINTASTLQEAFWSRIWVPGGFVINKIGTFVKTAGTWNNTPGLNGFAIYSDDGQTQLWTSALDDTMWQVSGEVSKTLGGSAITAPAGGAWYRCAMSSRNYSAAPVLHYMNTASTVLPDLGGRHAWYLAVATWPTSFTPATYGNNTGGYMPLILLG